MENDDYLLDADLLPIMLSQRERNAMRPAFTSIEPEIMRQRASEEFAPWNEGAVEIDEIKDFSIPAGDYEIPVRLYDHSKGKNQALLIYFHGGGWIIGDLELEDSALRRIAKESEIRILSVDYRLAPEFRFPAPLEDGQIVYEWVAKNAEKLNIDMERISFGGASAGANVAFGTLLRLRDNLNVTPKHITMLYGVFDKSTDYESYNKYGDGRFGLPSAAMEFFWNSYLGDITPDKYAIPLLDNLDNLPMTGFIYECELDVLAGQSAQMAKRLKEKGADIEHKIYKGAVHGLSQYSKSSEQSRQSLSDIAQNLKKHLL